MQNEKVARNKEVLADGFISRNFRSTADLLHALAPEALTLLLDPDVATALGALKVAKVRAAAIQNRFVAIEGIMGLLRQPTQSELRRAVLQFVLDTAWLHDCLAVEPKYLDGGGIFAGTQALISQPSPPSSAATTLDLKELLGRGFVRKCFESPGALISALELAHLELIQDEILMDLLAPSITNKLYSPDDKTQREGAQQVVALLFQPPQKELQKRILDFILPRQYLRFYLDTAVAAEASHPVATSEEPPPSSAIASKIVISDREGGLAEASRLQAEVDTMWNERPRFRNDPEYRARLGDRYKTLAKCWRMLGSKPLSRRNLVRGFVVAGHAALESRDLRLARASFARAAELLDELGDPCQATFARHLEARAAGNPTESRRLYQTAFAMSRKVDQTWWAHNTV